MAGLFDGRENRLRAIAGFVLLSAHKMVNAMMKVIVTAVMAMSIGCAVSGDDGIEEDTSEVKRVCHAKDPDYQYIGTSKRQCAVIRFYCAEGTAFFDDCGCGCYVPSCPIIDCAAPPDGCHYEGAVFSPCDQQTCGTLVCDGSTL